MYEEIFRNLAPEELKSAGEWYHRLRRADQSAIKSLADIINDWVIGDLCKTTLQRKICEKQLLRSTFFVLYTRLYAPKIQNLPEARPNDAISLFLISNYQLDNRLASPQYWFLNNRLKKDFSLISQNFRKKHKKLILYNEEKNQSQICLLLQWEYQSRQDFYNRCQRLADKPNIWPGILLASYGRR